MKFLIKSISGRQGYKSFKTLNEYVDFMTKKGHLIKDLQEADLPYTDKPVKLPKISSSKGWSEVSDFGEVGEEAEKGESLIASTSKSVMKDEASFEMSKSSGKADKQEMGLGAEKGDVDMSDFKSFEYEEPKIKSSETKSEKPSSEGSKKESSEKSSDKKDEDKSFKKEDSNKSEEKSSDKKDSSKKYDKDIEECLRAAGVVLNEDWEEISEKEVKSLLMDKEKISEGVWGAITGAGIGSLSGHPYAGASIGYIVGELVYNLLVNWTKAKTQEQFIQKLKKYSKDPHTFLEKGYKEIDKMQLLSDREKQEAKDKLAQMFVDSMRDSFSNEEDKEIEECLKKEKISEGIKDYLPRAGFIRDDDEDKSSSKMGVWGGQGTDEQLRKAKIIAKVKFANGDRFGRVTKADLDNFDEYKAQYDEIYGSDELDEGWKDKLKKGAAAIGVAGALAGNAMASDPMYDGARSPDTLDHTQEYSQSVDNVEKPQIKRITKNGMIIDQFGNEWTREEFDKLANGEDPMYNGARNPNIEESEEVIEEDNDELNLEIAECLRAAGC